MAVLALCLLWALAAAVRSAPVAPLGGPEPAQYEELTLLFHGALQLSQALNSVYRATEARLTEAGHSLGLFDQALKFLGTEVSQGRDATQELRTSLSEIQVEEDALHLRAEATARSLGEVARAQQALRATVRRLQVQLRGAWLGQAHQEFETLKTNRATSYGLSLAMCSDSSGRWQSSNSGCNRSSRDSTRQPSQPETAWMPLRTSCAARNTEHAPPGPERGRQSWLPISWTWPVHPASRQSRDRSEQAEGRRQSPVEEDWKRT